MFNVFETKSSFYRVQGMNFFELFGFVCSILGSLAGGYFGSNYGTYGVIVGFPLGFVIGYIIGIVIGVLILFLGHFSEKVLSIILKPIQVSIKFLIDTNNKRQKLQSIINDKE
jgi:MFS family permease